MSPETHAHVSSKNKQVDGLEGDAGRLWYVEDEWS